MSIYAHRPVTTSDFNLNAQAEPPRILSLPCGPWRLGLTYAWACNVVKAGPLARVPCTPTWLLGVTNWEGEIVPVVDLARWLGWPSDSAAHRHWIVGGDEGARLALSVAGRPTSAAWEALTVDAAVVSALPAALGPLVQAAWPCESSPGHVVLNGVQLFDALTADVSLFCALPGTTLPP